MSPSEEKTVRVREKLKIRNKRRRVPRWVVLGMLTIKVLTASRCSRYHPSEDFSSFVLSCLDGPRGHAQSTLSNLHTLTTSIPFHQHPPLGPRSAFQHPRNHLLLRVSHVRSLILCGSCPSCPGLAPPWPDKLQTRRRCAASESPIRLVSNARSQLLYPFQVYGRMG